MLEAFYYLIGLLLVMCSLVFDSQPARDKISSEDKTEVETVQKRLQVPFIENIGQVDDHAAFYAQVHGGTVCVTKDGQIAYFLSGTNGDNASGKMTFEEEFAGGSVREIRGLKQTATSVSYFTGGDSSRWKTGIPTYDMVDLGEVFEGIRLKLKACGNSVEKVFFVEPGADPRSIAVEVKGSNLLSVNAAGELEVDTELGSATFTKPVAYQEVSGERRIVDVAYKVAGDKYSFEVGNYNINEQLVIDPLLASTYLGGSNIDGQFGSPLVLAADGSIYVASRTKSSDFPFTPGAYDTTLAAYTNDVFVAKFNNELSDLLAATYIGGSSDDGVFPGVGLCLDSAGNVYVTGKTSSLDYPTTDGAYSRTRNGTWDAFISKLGSDLDTLLASTYFGGSGAEYYLQIAVDGNGDIILTGSTSSTDSVATDGAYDADYNGGGSGPYPGDVFITKLDAELTTVISSSYLGGTMQEYCEDVALDQDGNVYLAGWTASSNFPASPGPYNGGMYDAFVAKMSSDLTQLLACKFLGGSLWDFGYRIALNDSGDVYVTGHTASSNFPHSPTAYDTSYGGGAEGTGDDVFVTRFDNDLSMLASTYLGGELFENGQGLTIDPDGNVVVAGDSRSDYFPVLPGSYQDCEGGGGSDGWITVFDRNLEIMLASTCLGGSGKENLVRVTVDEEGTIYVSGCTASSDFPSTPGAWDEDYNGSGEAWVNENMGGDVYVAKLFFPADIDGDGLLNHLDNCPLVANPDQEDEDLDEVGDSCDNCIDITNADQDDADGDGSGDLCDPDADDDSILNDDDNCWLIPNPSQEDSDSDSLGNVCDNCPYASNYYQYDEDDDGIGDACDEDILYIQCCLDMPDAYYGVPFSYQFWAIGGDSPYHWERTLGQLPYGLALSEDGVLSGIPAYKATTAFKMTVEDQLGATDEAWITITVDDAPPPPYICGDADGSEEVDIDDVVYLIAYIFSGGPAPDPLESGDADCSGEVDIDDVVYVITYIFSSGLEPCAGCP